jgi:hypothetical protein
MLCFLFFILTHFLFVGSGRVTFNNHKSYMKAVCAGFIELKTPKFTKKVRKSHSLSTRYVRTACSQLLTSLEQVVIILQQG